MEFDSVKLIMLCFFVGLASFVDAIAGGGGVISTSAYLALGFPPHITLGTGKTSGLVSGLVSVVRYARQGRVIWSIAPTAMAFSFLGGWLGAKLSLLMSERTLTVVLLCALPLVLAFQLLRRQSASEESRPLTLDAPTFAKAAAIGFFIGAYEGMLGPGTGTFLILAFSSVLGMSLLDAGGTSKLVNYAGSAAAAFLYFRSGKVLWLYAAPTAICGMIGSYLGAGLALKNGARVIRPMMLAVTAALFCKTLWDLCM